ncbi:hypothetical protein SAV14893_083150 [Streptomyces avermitilis]|uniref:HTH tetR-type domain-containing protein n=1 Tax=Streptomyces avermitilis TaxID=33903 RepID=A0A4D4MAK5_STRAX|nr:hypothetical protein SAV14893_083150 [Streptomyces avermitilis]
MGRVSQAQAQENRRRVVDTASRLFREQGTQVSVADLMKAAGLTHGAFYKQFASKEALVDEATAHAFAELARRYTEGLERYEGRRDAAQQVLIDTYLSVGHRDGPADGCPVAALASGIAREGGGREARRVYTEGWPTSPTSSPPTTRTASSASAPCSERWSCPGPPTAPRSPRRSSPPRAQP